MKTKNSVSLIGMVGKDAEVRQTQQGVPYARFSLATSTGGYKKQDGTQVPEQTQWHNIMAWRSLADFAGKWVKKGMKVAVDGMITYGSYKNQQGQVINTVEILCDDLILMSVPQSQQQPQPQPAQQPQQVQRSYQAGGYQQQPQQNNNVQGTYQQQSPFPPPVDANGLPF